MGLGWGWGGTCEGCGAIRLVYVHVYSMCVVFIGIDRRV